MKKHYVHYVTNSTPILKSFKTIALAKNFVTKFKKEHKNEEMQGYWVDFIISGEIVDADEYYEDCLDQ
jgi:hypothetical protein